MIGRTADAVARTSLEPALVRLGVFAAALVALLVSTLAAMPAGLPPPLLVVVVVLAALPAVAPGGPWVTVVVLAAAAGWLAGSGLTVVAGTGGTGLAGQVSEPGRLLVLAGSLYLLHSLAALAVTLPYDAVVAPDVLTRWLLRTLGVVVASSLLSVAVLLGLAPLADGRAYLLASLGGLALAIAVAALLRRRGRPLPPPPTDG